MLEGRIDIEKLKQVMKGEKHVIVEAASLVPAAAPKSAKNYDNRVCHSTLLYALRSHLRGKLHMTKKRVIVGPVAASGCAIYPVTMEDQEKLIASAWEAYRLEEEATGTDG
jgi:hypothetical protein